jgi:hypothetical protein
VIGFRAIITEQIILDIAALKFPEQFYTEFCFTSLLVMLLVMLRSAILTQKSGTETWK